jgi:hypothetical protein
MNIAKLTAYCRTHLDFANLQLDQAYFYQSLPLCVIDAVYSIGVRYSSTEATVRRFCEHFNLTLSRGAALPEQTEQLSIQEFLDIYNDYGVERMADEVYRNRQRTSSRNGILKAEALRLFAQVLCDHGVNYFQEVPKAQGSADFEHAIMKIPGQHSGISLRYFYMLAGDSNFIKPDRMIKRFLFAATGEDLSDDECQSVLEGACRELAKDHAGLTPRVLDNLIWNYQRNVKV